MNAVEVAKLRRKADQRQIAGFVIIFGILTLVPFNGGVIATSAATEGTMLSLLILNIIGVTWSLMGVVVGLWALIYDRANWWVSIVSVVWTYTSIAVFTGQIAAEINQLVLDTVNGNPYVPLSFDPTITEVRVVGSMGVLGIFAYAATAIGALVAAQLALMHFQNPNAWVMYNCNFYRARAIYYAGWIFTSGLAQLILGFYALARFGNGPYEEPLTAALYVVTWPEATIFIGFLQLFLSLYSFYIAWYSKKGSQVYAKHKNVYMWYSFFVFLAVMGIQLLMQLAPTNTSSGGANQTCFYLALSIAILWLIVKANEAPAEIDAEYYALSSAVSPTSSHESDGMTAEKLEGTGKSIPEQGQTEIV